MVCLHGRTRVQMYGGAADREIIKNVKQRLHIPLVANGDITSAEAALTMLSDTGADGIAIGRGAVGNPFIFSEILSALNGERCESVTLNTRAKTALFQLKTAISDKGEATATAEARKQIAMYLKGFRGAANLRGKINTATTYGEIEEAFAEALKENEE